MQIWKELVETFRRAGATLATAESCTGGLIGKNITDISGASEMYLGGVISYANSVKEKVLGVPADTLLRFGAVSKQTARAMAAGALSLTGADFSVAVTGIAGPSGGTPEKPVGLVYIAVGEKKSGNIFVTRNIFSGDRDSIRESTTERAAELVSELYASGNVENAV